jgi:Leucine-rich repeat (LRR) protein
MNGTGSGMTPATFNFNAMLVSLTLVRCSLTVFHAVTLLNFMHLDLSSNQISSIDVEVVARLKNLRFLSLSDNPLKEIYSQTSDERQWIWSPLTSPTLS